MKVESVGTIWELTFGILRKIDDKGDIFTLYLDNDKDFSKKRIT